MKSLVARIINWLGGYTSEDLAKAINVTSTQAKETLRYNLKTAGVDLSGSLEEARVREDSLRTNAKVNYQLAEEKRYQVAALNLEAASLDNEGQRFETDADKLQAAIKALSF